MSNADEEHDGEKPKGVFTTLLADGEWLFQKGEYKKAIDSFTTALALKPDDKSCLVGRSKCFLKTGNAENALKDAEASLKYDKTYFEGLYQKAEALYYMAEFEFALVFYQRGQKLRPQIQGFRLGIQKAQEAIENSVGSPSTVQLAVKGDLSFLKEDEEAQQNAIRNLTKDKPKNIQKNPKRKKTTKQLLGEFYGDRKYLENLMKDKDLIKGRTKGGEQLQDVLQSCLTYLDTCSDFWSQEQPIFPKEKSSKLKPHHSSNSEPAQYLLKNLQQIDEELTSGNAAESLKKVNEVMKEVQKWSEKEVPSKKEILGSLHSCTGNVLFHLGDMDKAIEHHQKDLELAKQCKLREAMSRALDNIGRVYARTGQFEQAIEFWEIKIPLVSDNLEKTWLFHEIGWSYLELNRHEKARDYGLRSVVAAKEIADEKWQMNANVLVAQSELNLGNLESCVSRFEEALNMAKHQGDDSAMTAIQKAMDEAKQQLPHLSR
ncbi:outer dynein arm-docking complex subunit 4 isoform X2 [Gouania willdenowi]|uniref:outer dynein arm-docking complex subunit 4 isoform X2 n=1 Tax=Gouania willdenowi TaxID=441366 RepID=UPI001056B5C3|nr:tetratricopeptide repeat protein 25 isoform X2 [Gouania willdenowi]